MSFSSVFSAAAAASADADMCHFQLELEKAVADLRLDYEHLRTENVSLKEDLQRLSQAQSLWKSRCLSAEAAQVDLRESLLLLQNNILKNLEYEKQIQALKQQKLDEEQHLRQSHEEKIERLQLEHEKLFSATRMQMAETERHYQSQITQLGHDLIRYQDREAKLTQESQIPKMLQDEMVKLKEMYKDLQQRVDAPANRLSVHTHKNLATESHSTTGAAAEPPAAKKKRVTFDINARDPPRNPKKTPARRSHVFPPPAAPSVPAPKSKSLSDLFSFDPEASATIRRSSSPFANEQKRKLYTPVLSSEEFLQ